MHVDDAFVAAVLEKSGTHYPLDIIRATLAVAAERGLVVPDGAPRMWTVRDCGCLIDIHKAEFFDSFQDADDYCEHGETAVRVAIVEIKEGGK